MNVLDENILESQRLFIRSRGTAVRQIGLDLGRKGMSDEEILPFLLTLSHPTFFTCDLGFASPRFCHARYCLVVLAIGQYEVAHFVRRLLCHPGFHSRAKRMGAVIRVMPTGWPSGVGMQNRKFELPILTDRKLLFGKTGVHQRPETRGSGSA